MDFKQIQNIIKDFENSNITNLEIELDNFKIKLNKNINVKEEVIQNTPTQKVSEVKDYQVKSPLVGTFYAAKSPQDEPFVKIGQKVNKGDTLCIIEAMKIMNEITAPVSGEISDILVQNGEPVGFDEVIFMIK
ncbi:MAG TPA: biotin/lipoyl-containing protein [Haloplasmataceae bacterium]